MAKKEIINLTNANESLKNLTVNTNTNVLRKNFITGIQLDGLQLDNTCSNFKMYNNGSMITDGAINYSGSSAILVKNNKTTKYTIALTHDTPSSHRAGLWGVILACSVVPKNSNLLIHLNGQGVLNCYKTRLVE
jgi:hypothetical protein